VLFEKATDFFRTVCRHFPFLHLRTLGTTLKASTNTGV
jgi:hypothetical protein